MARALKAEGNATYLDDGQLTCALGDEKAAGAAGLSGEDHRGERYG